MDISVARGNESDVPQLTDTLRAARCSATSVGAILHSAPPLEAARQQIITRHIHATRDGSAAIYRKVMEQGQCWSVLSGKDMPHRAGHPRMWRGVILRDDDIMSDYGAEGFHGMFQILWDACANIMGSTPHDYFAALVTHSAHERGL
ncbi:hypothetical protein B0J12DRAFT_696777 [Macrophomina phaseolina]|uniref:Uncharacterized protein n=1 Tax=Macrophomina phaseolina TaxID=35725 RepID=A0ABQ8GLL7_9PEZI|nr:hypothetical protein B0J12DRAFT_696777 [Macrophomina phaseolina]